MEYARSLINDIDTSSPENLCGGPWTTIVVDESPDPEHVESTTSIPTEAIATG